MENQNNLNEMIPANLSQRFKKVIATEFDIRHFTTFLYEMFIIYSTSDRYNDSDKDNRETEAWYIQEIISTFEFMHYEIRPQPPIEKFR